MYLHTHYFMNLRRPASRLEIVTIVLSALAVFFMLIFWLVYVIAIPMRSGEPWMLGVTGLLLLFAAMPCMLIAQFQGRRREWLRFSGFPVQGPPLRQLWKPAPPLDRPVRIPLRGPDLHRPQHLPVGRASGFNRENLSGPGPARAGLGGPQKPGALTPSVTAYAVPPPSEREASVAGPARLPL